MEYENSASSQMSAIPLASMMMESGLDLSNYSGLIQADTIVDSSNNQGMSYSSPSLEGGYFGPNVFGGRMEYGNDVSVFDGQVFGVDLDVLNQYTHKLAQQKSYFEAYGDVLEKNLKDLASHGFSGAICSPLGIAATKARQYVTELADLMQRSKDFINTEVSEGSRAADAKAASEMAAIFGGNSGRGGRGGNTSMN